MPKALLESAAGYRVLIGNPRLGRREREPGCEAGRGFDTSKGGSACSVARDRGVLNPGGADGVAEVSCRTAGEHIILDNASVGSCEPK